MVHGLRELAGDAGLQAGPQTCTLTGYAEVSGAHHVRMPWSGGPTSTGSDAGYALTLLLLFCRWSRPQTAWTGRRLRAAGPRSAGGGWRLPQTRSRYCKGQWASAPCTLFQTMTALFTAKFRQQLPFEDKFLIFSHIQERMEKYLHKVGQRASDPGTRRSKCTTTRCPAAARDAP